MTTRKEKEQNLAEWLATTPDEVVACRDLRHQWTGGYSWVLGHGFRGRTLSCRRCGAIKDQIIDKKGQIAVSRMMNYPDDYKKPADTPEGRVPLTAVRDEALSRSLTTDTVPVPLVAMFERITR